MVVGFCISPASLHQKSAGIASCLLVSLNEYVVSMMDVHLILFIQTLGYRCQSIELIICLKAVDHGFSEANGDADVQNWVGFSCHPFSIP